MITHYISFILFIIYYTLTFYSIVGAGVLNNLSFYAWFFSMFITGMDNLKKFINGINKYEKLTKPKHLPKGKKNMSHKGYKFHGGFYRTIILLEASIGTLAVLVHIGIIPFVNLYIEIYLMLILTSICAVQSLVQVTVDCLGLEDIEEIR